MFGKRKGNTRDAALTSLSAPVQWTARQGAWFGGAAKNAFDEIGVSSKGKGVCYVVILRLLNSDLL